MASGYLANLFMRFRIQTIYFLFAVSILIFPSVLYAAQLGEAVNFKITPSYDSRGRSETTAFLKRISASAYFYVERDFWDSLDQTAKNDFESKLDVLAMEFDQNIYPNITALFGSEWKPGIDNDERVTILLALLHKNAGGYFDSGNEFSKQQNPDSNEREMLYLNASFLTQSRAKVFLAHEFQHLISFFQKDKRLNKEDDVWLNEVRSEYAPYFLNMETVYRGSNIESRARQFLSNSSDSLTEWRDALDDYGSVGMLTYYLGDRFGSSFFSEIMKSDKVGIESASDALKRVGSSETFSDIFADWLAANYLNDPSLESGHYSYKNSNFANIRVSPNFSLLVSSLPVTLNFSTKDWTPRWHEFVGTGQGILKLEFKSPEPSADFRAPYIINEVSGQKTIKFLDLKTASDGQAGTLYLSDFGPKIRSVVVSPFSRRKTADFTDNDPASTFSLTASIITDLPAQAGMPAIQEPVQEIKESVQEKPAQIVQAPEVQFPNLPDSSLIRAKGDYKVYVTTGKHKRHILNPQVFGMYGHFKWAEIVELSPEEAALYKESALVRADGDGKVYEMNADGTKHWLNISAESFSLSGRTWDSVFIINSQERDFYLTGADVRY